MKQTAVEWLIEQWPVIESQLPNWLINQAKAMEKEQMKEMYIKGIENYDPTFKRKDNETFKSE